MTNDELERIMNFIIQRQERSAEHQGRVDERLDRVFEGLEQVQAALAELARRDADKEQRIARFERSYVAISELLQRHDGQIVALTDGLNSLTRTVERYINARGSNERGGD